MVVLSYFLSNKADSSRASNWLLCFHRGARIFVSDLFSGDVKFDLTAHYELFGHVVVLFVMFKASCRPLFHYTFKL
jgi:hypothetical protein